ncbi:hypothetical protein P261_00627 [Lachnospiraceae bacterium TWA4]|nr:hypothetical protein P261_00627 [Lachnospiraceae bacterium TWA4]
MDFLFLLMGTICACKINQNEKLPFDEKSSSITITKEDFALSITINDVEEFIKAMNVDQWKVKKTMS